MDPVFFTLAVTLPIIAIGLLVWLWVRRSSTPETYVRRRKLLNGLLITFCLAFVLYKVFTGTPLYRSFAGIATVTFSNESGAPLQDLVIVTRSAEGRRFTNNSQSYPSRGTYRLEVRTSELALEHVSFQKNTQHLTYQGGAANRGETLRVRVDSSGQFSSRK